MGRVFSIYSAISNSQMPSGCLTIQLNSDTGYLEITSDSTDYRFRPTRNPTTHVLQRPVQVQVVTCAFEGKDIDWKFQYSFLGFG